jgi:hypothetical protein
MSVNLSNRGWEGQQPRCPHMARSYGERSVFQESGNASLESSVISFLQHGSTSALSLETCFQSMCMPGSLKCEKCESSEGILFGTIASLPEILICQVARFGKRWFGLGKMHNIVSFTDSDMDMSRFAAADVDCGPSVYELAAVVSHSGTLSGGHYFCYARCKGRWSLYNDAEVTPVAGEEVLKSQAYLLFYTKRAPADVERVRQPLPVGVAIPILTCSDPRMWRESVPGGESAEIFVAAEGLANGKVTRPPNDEDLKRRFVRELLTSRCAVEISETACEQIRDFLCRKDAPTPTIFNLHEESGIVVGEAVRMFYRDPETFGIDAEESRPEIE